MYDLKVVQTKLFAKITNVARMNEQAVSTLYITASDLMGENANSNWYRRRAPGSKIGTFAPPIVLVVDGENFTAVTDVLVMGRSAQFEVVTNTRLFVVIPADLEDRLSNADAGLTSDIFVLTDSKNLANASLMTYSFGKRTEKIAGAAKLASNVVKLLMTTQGTDDFEPRAGAGLRAIPGTNIRDGGDLVVPVVLAVKRVEQNIIDSQRNFPKLTSSEKLRGIDVLAINFSPDTPGVLALTLKITPMSTESVAVQMMAGAEKLLQDIISGDVSVGKNAELGFSG